MSNTQKSTIGETSDEELENIEKDRSLGADDVEIFPNTELTAEEQAIGNSYVDEDEEDS